MIIDNMNIMTKQVEAFVNLLLKNSLVQKCV